MISEGNRQELRVLWITFLVLTASSLTLLSAPTSVAAAGSPPDVTTSSGNTTYPIGGSGTVIDPAVTAQDAEADTVEGARVVIQNKHPGDTLSFTSKHGITGNYDSSTGILELSGTATPSEYQDVFRTVTFSNTLSDPNTTSRRITFSLGTALPYEGTDHFYEFISESKTWSAANTSANGKSYFGLQGYLATVNSSGENDFIEKRLQGDGWLGASDDLSFSFVSENSSGYDRWYWVTGPEQGTHFWTGDKNEGVTCDGDGCGDPVGNQYSKWGNGTAGTAEEPNDVDGDGTENYAHIYHDRDGRWNDFPGDQAVDGYVIEYGGMPNDPSVTWRDTKTVALKEPANFSVTIDETNASVLEGEPLAINVTINNTGGIQATQDIVLTVNGTEESTKSRTIEGGSDIAVNFTYTTASGDAPAVAVNVSSADDFDTTTATVNEPANFSYSSLSVSPSTMAVGSSVTAEATVENTGDVEGTFNASLQVNGTVRQWENGTLDGGNSTTVSFNETLREPGAKRITIESLSAQTVTVVDAWSTHKYDYRGSGQAPAMRGPIDPVAAKWTFQTGGRVQSGAAIVDGRAYIGSADGSVYAVDTATGAEVWSTSLGSSIAALPTVANGLVYVGVDSGEIYAVNASTGVPEWSTQVAGDLDRSVAVVDGVVYHSEEVQGSATGALKAFDAETGTLRWSSSFTFSESQMVPAIADGLAVIGSNDGNVYAINLSSHDREWTFSTGGVIGSSPAIVNGTVYIGSNDGSVYALQLADGAKRWEYSTGGQVRSSPAVWNGTVYVGSKDHTLYALDAETGAEQWTYSAADSIVSAPAIVNGTVYFGSYDDSVYAVDATTGVERWQYATGGAVIWGVTVFNGTVYAGSDDSSLYALDTAANVSVTIDQTNASVVEGETLSVNVTVENTGDLQATQDIELSINGSQVATEPRTLSGGSSKAVNFTYSTTTGDAPALEVNVSSADDFETTTVSVNESANFSVTIDETTAGLVEGDLLTVDVTIVNTGDVPSTQPIEFAINGTVKEAPSLTLDGGNSSSQTFAYRTFEGDTPALAVNVSSADSFDTATLPVDNNTPPIVLGDELNLTNPTDRQLEVSFSTHESVSIIDVAILNVTGDQLQLVENLTTIDFDETAGVGVTFSYNATTTVAGDGEFEALLITAEDRLGLDGADGENDTVTVDTLAPTVPNGSFALRNPSARELRVSFNASEKLAKIAVELTGPEAATLVTTNFSETRHADAYTYNATYIAGSDGNYSATLTVAEDAAGNDGAQNETDAVSIDTIGPPSPRNLSATPDAGGVIEVSFDDVDGGATYYTIYRTETNASSGFVNITTVRDDNRSTYNFTDTNLTDATAYEYQVAATDGVGNEGVNTSSVNATADATAPTLASATSINASAISVDIGDRVDVNESTITAADFALNASAAVSNLSVKSDGPDAVVVIRFEPVDRTALTVSINGSIADWVGNSLSNESTVVSVVDGVAPTITSSNVTLSNPAGRTVTLTIDSSEALSTITVELRNATNRTLTRADFDEQRSNGVYRYVSSFEGSSDGTYAARLTEATDAAGNDGARNQTASVTIKTTVTDPGAGLGVSTRVLNFGNVTVGATETLNITVENLATAEHPLTVDATTISGENRSAFDVVSGAAPFTLDPGETHVLEVAFKPTSAGIKEAQLQIVSRANESQIDVWLTNTRTHVVVQAVEADRQPVSENATTVNVEGVNLDNNTRLAVNLTRPELANRSATIDVIEMTVTESGNFSLNVTHAPEPVRADHATYTGNNTMPLQYVHIEHPRPDSAFTDTAFVLRVAKASLPAGTSPNRIELLRLENGSWDPQSVTLRAETDEYLLYRVVSDGFSQFVVVGPESAGTAAPKPESNAIVPVRLPRIPGNPGPAEAAAGGITISLGWVLRPFLRDIIATFVIHFERSFRVGDEIEWAERHGTNFDLAGLTKEKHGTAGNRGVVEEIGYRSTWIRTHDEGELAVPNAVLSDAVLANARVDGPLRLQLVIPVDLQADLDRAKAVIRSAALEHEAVLDDPEPTVYFLEFAEFRTRLRLHVWIADQDIPDRFEIEDELWSAVRSALSESGVALEYPTQQQADPMEVL